MKSILRLQEIRDTSPGLKSLGHACERLRISSLGHDHNARVKTHQEKSQKQQHRVIVMGAAKVGKSCIISQFLYDRYLPRYRETVEELHRGEYELPDGASLTLDILDTAGAFQFPAMRSLSISTGGAFILVYAVDDLESWEEVTRLREQIIDVRGMAVPIVVVGNKNDQSETVTRAVRREIAETVATLDWECGYVECSAKENENIIEVFKELLVQAKVRYNLSPAVRRRRQSLPNFSSGGRGSSSKGKPVLKRHSCTVA